MTAARLFNPDEKKALARARYGNRCDLCGDITAGSLGRKRAPLRCRPCKDKEWTRYSRMLILACIEMWNDLYGMPPRAYDWNPRIAPSGQRRREAEERLDHGHWPSVSVVRRQFGSWNAALETAGFEPRNRHQKRLGGRSYPPETRARAIGLAEDGMTRGLIAETLGVGRTTINRWCKQADVTDPRHPLPTGTRRPYIPPALRWEVWERDNFTCQQCGIRRFLSIDHIKPIAAGGTTTLGNLQTLCQPCNSGKGSAWSGAVF
jgi:hypothetical protein